MRTRNYQLKLSLLTGWKFSLTTASVISRRKSQGRQVTLHLPTSRHVHRSTFSGELALSPVRATRDIKNTSSPTPACETLRKARSWQPPGKAKASDGGPIDTSPHSSSLHSKLMSFIYFRAGTPTITVEGSGLDMDSISVVSSIAPPHIYQCKCPRA